MRFGYIAASAGVAAAVVFMLDINAAAAGATVEDRLFSVVIGGGLAVVAHVVLPDHALTRSATTRRRTAQDRNRLCGNGGQSVRP